MDPNRPLRLVLAALAVWRLTHLLAEEDGPWGLVARLRGLAGRGGAHEVAEGRQQCAAGGESRGGERWGVTVVRRGQASAGGRRRQAGDVSTSSHALLTS